jgi:hypothetical protein
MLKDLGITPKLNELCNDVDLAHKRLYEAIHEFVTQNRQPTPEERKAAEKLRDEVLLATKRLDEEVNRERIDREWIKHEQQEPPSAFDQELASKSPEPEPPDSDPADPSLVRSPRPRGPRTLPSQRLRWLEDE